VRRLALGRLGSRCLRQFKGKLELIAVKLLALASAKEFSAECGQLNAQQSDLVFEILIFGEELFFGRHYPIDRL
jgi:hypothetical protein